MQRLKVSENKRFLSLADNTPFFWLGDTAWELFHRLTVDEAREYLKIRSEQSFNVVQAVILSEFDGLRTATPEGYYPLKADESGRYMPECPNEDYFAKVDKIIDIAESYGIYVALLPSWGDKWNIEWGKGPEIFDGENGYIYGKYLGERYKDKDNIVWVMGGDRQLKTAMHFNIINNMAKGIKDGGATQIMTLHPMGGQSSSMSVHNEPWLDFNMIQSGHGELFSKNAQMIEHDYNLSPTKPVVEGECNYEDHPKGFNPKNGYFDDTDVRFASYNAVFSGSLGITYGHHSVWSMLKAREEFNTIKKTDKPHYFIMTMKEALCRPAAEQMRHLRDLIESHGFYDRVPAQDRLEINYVLAQRQAATAGDNYLLVYCPCGLPCKVKDIGRDFTARWFNPRTGEYTKAEGKDLYFIPPHSGRNFDYVLEIMYL
jgi:hypothetical protein